MIARAALSALLPLAATAMVAGAPSPAHASEKDKRFFSNIEGQWSGPGEIVAGKYKGTKFTCNFTGATPNGKVGMSLDGGCRVGLFTQRMSATVEHADLAVGRRALEIAGEAGALVLAGDDLARPRPFALDRAEEALVLLRGVGRPRRRRKRGDRDAKR